MKVRVHVASMNGSWETELLSLELARQYGQQHKKKQPIHSVTLRGFEDGHIEEIPKQQERKRNPNMAFRKVSAKIEGWAGPQEGATLIARKFSEKVIPADRKNKERTLLICELGKPYMCMPADEDEGDELKEYPAHTIVGMSVNYALTDLLRYNEVVFKVEWHSKEKIGGGHTVWNADLYIDDEKSKLKNADALKATDEQIARRKSEATLPKGEVSVGKVPDSDDDDIPF